MSISTIKVNQYIHSRLAAIKSYTTDIVLFHNIVIYTKLVGVCFTLQPAVAVRSAESVCRQPDPRVLAEPGPCLTP